MLSFATDNEYSATDAHVARDALLQVAGECLTEDALMDDARRYDFLERRFGRDKCRRLGFFPMPPGYLVSVVIPVFNEAKTIEQVIQRVRDVGLPCEMVVVDDGSSDGTRDVLDGLRDEEDLTIVFHEHNQGKGAAIRTGFTHVRGDVVAIQDADMEYDPRDFWYLIEPIVGDTADVVYGSRFCNNDQSDSPLWHQTGNQMITWLSNLFTGLKFTDVETCYKVFRRDLVDRLAPGLRECRFGIEIEMTAKLAKMKGVRFYERPISYAKRTYAEGKKIGWRDGVRALWCMVRY